MRDQDVETGPSIKQGAGDQRSSGPWTYTHTYIHAHIHTAGDRDNANTKWEAIVFPRCCLLE